MGPKVALSAAIVADKSTANTERGNGIFYPKDPETIVILTGIADFYNQNIESPTHKDRAIQLVESTCLHELVHYLNWKHHKKVRGFTDADGNAIKEMGKSFEKDAYGRDIGSEGWMRKAAVAGADIPQGMASQMQVWEGTIVRVMDNILVVKSKRDDGTEKDLRHELAPKVVVTIDGRAAKLAELKPGQRVRVTPLRVEALDKNRDFQN